MAESIALSVLKKMYKKYGEITLKASFFSIGNDDLHLRLEITTVLDYKLTKNVGHFEENKFSVGCHKFLLDCCPKLI